MIWTKENGLRMIWIKERIIYKTASLTYKCIISSKLEYLSDLLTMQKPGSTRSSMLVTLQRPSNPSNRKIPRRSFQYAAPVIWNSLPAFLRERGDSECPLAHSYTSFHRELKTHLFGVSYPSSTLSVRPCRKTPFEH